MLSSMKPHLKNAERVAAFLVGRNLLFSPALWEIPVVIHLPKATQAFNDSAEMDSTMGYFHGAVCLSLGTGCLVSSLDTCQDHELQQKFLSDFFIRHINQNLPLAPSPRHFYLMHLLEPCKTNHR